MTANYRLGIDIGGTFTDFTLVDMATGAIVVEKCLTTPHEPEQAVGMGIQRLAAGQTVLDKTSQAIHATTLLTNIVLERKGKRTGLITTQGFRDILEMAREVRYDLYDLFIRFPLPLVARELRVGVSERTLADGSISVPLDEKQVREAIRYFQTQNVGAVAVCFLHSYRNPLHERRVGELLHELMPEAAVSLSHEVHPEPKEFERTSTTVVDAYVKPVASQYLNHLADITRRQGYRERLYVMLSNGGVATVDTGKQYPVQMLESGPAAGVEAASYFGRLLKLPALLSFDMGGTTAKLCLIRDGKAARTRHFEVDRMHRFKTGSGIPVAIPVYDLLEIGAGGGSIASVNDLGLLQVGPNSAGSDPGPTCYGLGGELPTVTDADLTLGLLNPDYFLGGEITLDPGQARAAIQSHIATPLGLSLEQAAWGMHDLVNETMASAARVYVTEKAQAPGDLTLVCFGGAGPVHAAGLARKLGCPRVLIPPYPGVMSAFGLLSAPLAFESREAVNRLLTDCDPAELERRFLVMEQAAQRLLPAGDEILFERSVDLRHAGQDEPITIMISPIPASADPRADWAQQFYRVYEAQYGRVDDDNPVELASLLVRVIRPTPAPLISTPSGTEDALPKQRRSAYCAEDSGQTVPVFERSALRTGQKIAGPAIVEERESTTVIGAGDVLTVNAIGCLLIEVALPQPTQTP